MNAVKLREKARELIRKAEEVENVRATKVGKMILRHHDNDFLDVTIDQLKAEISALIGQKSKTEKPKE
jgi:hypothetical protein